MEFPFPYTPIEPIVLTDLKNKLFANFYKFLTLPYNYLDNEFLSEYDNDDIRRAEPRRESNKIEFDQAYSLAESMVDDLRKAFNHFSVTTFPSGGASVPAFDPIQWGPMGHN